LSEQSIGSIIKKVTLWRNLYNGFYKDNQYIKYTLEDAADQVGISKKTLDDYLCLLRSARYMGFDFNKHKDQTIGILRQFMKTWSPKGLRIL